MSCNVCVENFNDSNRILVSCNKCKYESCRVCYETYFLSHNKVPNCINCKNEFEHSFFLEIFTKSFVRKFKENYKEFLFKKEMEMSGATMHLVEKSIQEDRFKDSMKKIQNEISLLKQKKSEIMVRDLTDEDFAELKSISDKLITLSMKMWYVKRENTEKLLAISKSFKKKCNQKDCRGYLNESSECIICKTIYCERCNEISDNSEHICKKETVETVEMLAKETKNCPKCSIPIYKIDGCDQIYCTQCHTPFSWETREIVNGRIHNPHYYEMRQNIERDILDIRCGRHIDNNMIVNLTSICTGNTDFIDFCYGIWELNSSILPSLVERYQDNTDIRVKYLKSSMTEKSFKTTIFKRFNQNEKRKELGKILSTYANSATEIVYRYLNSLNITEENMSNFNINKSQKIQKIFLSKEIEFLSELIVLSNYTNTYLEKIKSNYSSNSIMIGPNGRIYTWR